MSRCVVISVVSMWRSVSSRNRPKIYFIPHYFNSGDRMKRSCQPSIIEPLRFLSLDVTQHGQYSNYDWFQRKHSLNCWWQCRTPAGCSVALTNFVLFFFYHLHVFSIMIIDLVPDPYRAVLSNNNNPSSWLYTAHTDLGTGYHDKATVLYWHCTEYKDCATAWSRRTHLRH